ncbi:MAG: permease-like cell division protein FtsX [Halioglobus sp.]
MANDAASSRREGASLSRTSFMGRYDAWLRHHRQSSADSLIRVLDNPISSILTWLVIGIALALPVSLDVALDNAGRVSSTWDSPAQLSLFLVDGTSQEAAKALTEELSVHPQLARVQFVSREDALAEFTSVSGFADILENLEENPLPHVVLVEPLEDVDPAQVTSLREEFEALGLVAEATLDMAWLQRLNSLLELSRRSVLALGGFLIFGVVLILGNTIRLAIESRREEIVIVKLVGGSNAFVRRPFLYTGLWYGVGGGVFAALLVGAGLWFLSAPVEQLASLYGSDFSLRGPGLIGSLNLVLVGGMLGLIGAWLAVSRHLGAIEPR